MPRAAEQRPRQPKVRYVSRAALLTDAHDSFVSELRSQVELQAFATVCGIMLVMDKDPASVSLMLTLCQEDSGQG